MRIKNKVYGAISITEPVLVELIRSKPVQRLKGINQSGARRFIDKNENITGYSHSLGVLILLKKLGAPIEEQIAGLLHDISHTAFSHVVDFVFKSKDYDFHELYFRRITKIRCSALSPA